MDTDFAPFVPPNVTTGDFVDKAIADVLPPPPVHKKVARKKRPPAADKGKPERIPANILKKKKKRVIGRHPALAAPYGKKDNPIASTRALKLDMATAMAISADLKPTDFNTFAGVVVTLQAENKAACARILAAVGRVFA